MLQIMMRFLAPPSQNKESLLFIITLLYCIATIKIMIAVNIIMNSLQQEAGFHGTTLAACKVRLETLPSLNNILEGTCIKAMNIFCVSHITIFLSCMYMQAKQKRR